MIAASPLDGEGAKGEVGLLTLRAPAAALRQAEGGSPSSRNHPPRKDEKYASQRCLPCLHSARSGILSLFPDFPGNPQKALA